MTRLIGIVLPYFGDRIAPNLRTLLRERQPVVWLLAAVIGVAVALAVMVFLFIIGTVQTIWLDAAEEDVVATLASNKPWWLIISATTLGGLLVGLLVRYVLPRRRADAVADVIEARAVGGARIDARQGLGSALVSAVSLGCGASAGREGPAVHLGATISSWLAHRFDLPSAAYRALLGCGAAAAVSASFNAPIAGVLFALEVVLGHYALRAFIPIVISSVTATIVTRIHTGDVPIFDIPAYQITSYWEFPAFVLLGLTCGAVAICFQFALMASEWTAVRITMPLWLRPVAGGLVIGCIGAFYPEILGVGYEATNRALHNDFTLITLLTLLIAKSAATAITIASRFGGGVFSPSIYLGAMTGGAFGIISAGIFPDYASDHGLYAIVGMGAVSAAILGAPISTALIVFELTGGYEVVIALLLAISMSSGLMQAIHGQSLFHWQLSLRGLFLQEGSHRQIVRTIKVRDFMSEPSDEDREAFSGEDDTPIVLAASDSLEQALRAFDQAGDMRLPVVEADNRGALVGWARNAAALDAYNRALIETHEEEHR